MAALTYGWVGKILRADLSTGGITEIETSRYAPEFLGGRAMGAKIYWDEVAPEIGAYDPANRLIFTTGPAVGTLAPSANRVFVTAKSPVPYPRECYFFSSMGGHWGPELKFAGYDGVIVQGKAPAPVYLWINDGKAELKDARPLWGMIARDAQLALQQLHGAAARSIVIGPAGEHLCREAIITSETAFAAGQGGFGAVMGSKNLKAIAVKGTGAVGVAKPAALMDLYRHFAGLATCRPGEGRQNPVRYMKYYTNPNNATGGEGIDEVDDSALGVEIAQGLVKKSLGGCFACPLSCLVGWKFKDDAVPGGAGNCNENKFCKSAELAHYGGKPVGRYLIEAARLHDDLGLSETQTGFKFEYPWFWNLVKEGILTVENTGLPLASIGSSSFWHQYLHQIAYREGIGKHLAEGEERFFAALQSIIPERHRQQAKAMGERWLIKGGYGYYGHWGGGHMNNALSVLQQASEIRTNLQTQSHFLNPNAKACYLPPDERDKTARAGALKNFGTVGVLEQHSFAGMASAAIYLQDFSLVSDSVTYCRWVYPKVFSWYTADHLGDVAIGSKTLAAVTGTEMTEEELLKSVGEKGANLERMILVREGRRRQHDWYNDSVFERNKAWLKKESLSQALDEYYAVRGWDGATGIPRKSKLAELELLPMAAELENKYGIKVPS